MSSLKFISRLSSTNSSKTTTLRVSSSSLCFMSFQPTWSDSLFQKLFGGLGKWDAAYFLKIAEEGYKYEQYMAFFPLYPWILL